MKIILAIDVSLSSSAAVETALARYSGGNHRILVVPWIKEQQESACETLENLVNKRLFDAVSALRTRFGDENVNDSLLRSNLLDGISDLSRSWGADLVVVDVHDQQPGAGEPLADGLAEALSLSLPCSLLVVKSGGNTGHKHSLMKKLIIRLDGSPLDRSILERLTNQTWLQGTQMLLLQLFEPPALELNPALDDPLMARRLWRAVEREPRELSQTLMNRAVAYLKRRLPQVDAFGAVLADDQDIPSRIVLLSHQWGADLIVLGQACGTYTDTGAKADQKQNDIQCTKIDPAVKSILKHAHCSLKLVKGKNASLSQLTAQKINRFAGVTGRRHLQGLW